MSKVLSLKLRNEVFDEMETTLRRLKRPRNAYINQAVEHFNRLHRRRLLEAQYAKESAAVREESMRVLAEFEALPDDIIE
ncbi:MAG: hypothetical protein A2506_13405 [Elusimicrobia bacterium RIFOXYD12_FULL_66_9]|nr:MAG: hypothetical protein A2506_13405 [Elusimicrobia bacterium RIFOXYD12_FULL_66_9]